MPDAYREFWDRRRMLRAIAASLGAAAVTERAWAQAPHLDSQPPQRAVPPAPSADQVLDVMEFEPLAKDALPPAHYGYLATGTDDDQTVVRNHAAFSHYEIRAHRFTDVSHLTLQRSVFGERWQSPLYLSAVSAMRAFHPDGELAVARAARTRGVQQMLSSGSSTSVQDVMAARGQPVWQQLYATNDWSVTEGLVKRAQQAGCTAVALTVDSAGGRNNETLKRAMRLDNRHCENCHVDNRHDLWRRAPLYQGLDVSRVTGISPLDITPQYLDRLRALVKGRLIVKGIVTGEDAVLALQHGADAIVVSNHGGRNEETLRACIDCLPEVAAAVQGRIPVLIDGGFRRGTDVFKALALGATAVGIGRPQAWGLAAFGQPGVEAVIDILNRELADIMRHAGTAGIDDIGPSSVVRAI